MIGFRSARRVLFMSMLACLVAGCDSRLASVEEADVCRIAKPILETYLPVQAATAQDSAPAAGVCQFKLGEGRSANRLSVVLYTKASMEPSARTFDSVYRISIAEATQTYGVPGSNALADLSKQSAHFRLGDSFAESYVVDKGLMLMINAGDRALTNDQGLAFTREIWKALLVYRPDKK